MIVTSLPNRRKIDANSTPTAPLPRIAIDFGTSAQMNRLVAGDDRACGRSSMPGTLRGADPVATTISLACERARARRSVTSTRAGAGQPRGALDPVDLVLLEQELDAFGQARDDLVLARVDARHVDATAWPASPNVDAPLVGVLRDLERVRVLEQRLGRNAAPVQAGAAERGLPLDDGGLQAELRGADRGDVPAGSGADDDEVVLVSQSGTPKDRGDAATPGTAVGSSDRSAWPPSSFGHPRAQAREVVPQFPV